MHNGAQNTSSNLELSSLPKLQVMQDSVSPAPSASKPQALSAMAKQTDSAFVIDTLGQDDVGAQSDDATDEEGLTIFLAEDIYCFLIFLLQRVNSQTNKSFFSELCVQDKIKLVFYTILCFVVQFGGVLFFALAESYYLEDSSELVTYNCNSVYWDEAEDRWSPPESTDSSLAEGQEGQECTFYDYHYVGIQEYDAQLFLAKAIGVFMALIFVSPDFGNLVRAFTVLAITRRCAIRILWVIFVILNVCLVAVLCARMLVIIFNQNGVIDALTVGIGFIILSELDNKMHECVAEMNPLFKYGGRSGGVSRIKPLANGQASVRVSTGVDVNLFEVELSAEDVKQTIYRFIHPSTLDFIFMVGVTITFAYSAFYFQFIFPDVDAWNNGSSDVDTFDETGWTFLGVLVITVVPPMLLPLVFVFRGCFCRS